jgi:nucleoside-diphosphate-sugar epimerase
MTVSILGCGWFGKALAVKLMQEGIQVKGSATNVDKQAELSAMGIKAYVVNFPNIINNGPEFFNTDVLVISIPPKFRKGETELFIPKIESIIASIKQAGISKVIYTSSTGVYGDAQETVNELTIPEPGDEQGQLLLQAEQLLQAQTDFKTTVIRFGGLVGVGRHPGRFFTGKTNVPNGLSPVNLVHLNDAVGIAASVIESDAWGYVFNACHPKHPTRGDFYQWATQQAGLQLPSFINELGTTKTVESIQLKQVLGYQFLLDNWGGYTFS